MNSISLSQLHSRIYDGTRKLKPQIGDVFFINLDRIGHIPGMVADIRIDKSGQQTFLVYIYNEILKSKDEIPKLDKTNLMFPPKNVLRNNWSKGMGFDHRYSLPKEEIDIFTEHCFYSEHQIPPIYRNNNNEVVEKFEPLVPTIWSNITTISIDIIETVEQVKVLR